MTENKAPNQSGMIAKTQKKAVAAQTTQKTTMKDYVQMMMPEVEKALPATMTPDRFTRIVLSALSNNPKLQECTPKSFLSAMMQSAQLGLEPNTPLGQAYLIPFNNHGQMECQYQIGYKGLLDLAHRAGTNIEAHEVYSGDSFEYSFGLEPTLKHIPALKDRGEVIAYYAVWRNGEAHGFEVMSAEDVRRHAQKYSKAYSGNSPWKTDFDAMAKKTVIKQALKYAPLSIELQKNLSADETVKHEITENMNEVQNDISYADIIADEETGEVIDAEVVEEAKA